VRIVAVAHYGLPQNRGGSELMLHELLTALARAGHHPELIVTEQDGPTVDLDGVLVHQGAEHLTPASRPPRRTLERAALRARDRAARAEWARDRRDRLAAAARALRPVAPLVMVTAFAMFGQVGYAFDNLTEPSWVWPVRAVVAVGFAVTAESIANTVAWYAHAALLDGDTPTASRRRVASYLLAGGVAGVNYAHFADGWAPTPGAVVFALFSALQPWLWGMHTRRTHHLQLKQKGRVDDTGAVFSSARWRAFPYRTWLARRYSIAHGVTDPRLAWEGSEAERLARRAAREASRRDGTPGRLLAVLDALGMTLSWLNGLSGTSAAPASRTDQPSAEQDVEASRTNVRTEARTEPRTAQDGQQHASGDHTGTPRRRLVPVDTDRENDFRKWAAELDEPPTAYQVRKRYGCRQSVAERLLSLLDGEADKEPEREAVGVG
jgi:hypothetical protein